jgi:hypothetical protein
MANTQNIDDESKISSSVKKRLMFRYAAAGAILIIVLGGMFAAGFYFGVVRAKKASAADTIKKILDPAATFLNLPSNETGKVKSVSSDKLVIAPDGQDDKEIVVKETVPITRKGKKIKLADVKNNELATVFVQEKDGTAYATRVIVR